MAAQRRKKAAELVIVRLTAVVSGGPVERGPGDQIEVDQAEADRLVAAGAAVVVGRPD